MRARHIVMYAKRRIMDEDDDFLDVEDMDDDLLEDVDEDDDVLDGDDDDDLGAALDGEDDETPEDEVNDAFTRQRKGRVLLDDDDEDDDGDLAQLLEDDDLADLAVEEDDDVQLEAQMRARKAAAATPQGGAWLQAFEEETEEAGEGDEVCGLVCVCTW